MELEAVDFNLRELIDHVLKQQLFLIREKNLSLNATAAPDVPDWIRGDPTRLRQVLTKRMPFEMDSNNCPGACCLIASVRRSVGPTQVFDKSSCARRWTVPCPEPFTAWHAEQ